MINSISTLQITLIKTVWCSSKSTYKAQWGKKEKVHEYAKLNFAKVIQYKNAVLVINDVGTIEYPCGRKMT